MKQFLLFSLTILVSNFIAQPILNYNNPLFQNSYAVSVSRIWHNGYFDVNQNAVWDFSNETPDFNDNLEIKNSSETPLGSFVAESNLAFIMNDKYSYFNMNSDSIVQFTESVQYLNTDNDYRENPCVIMKFPFEIDDNFVDYFINNGDDDYYVAVNYLNYGTLKLPNGIIHSNIARVNEQYNRNNSFNTSVRFYSADPFYWIAFYDGSLGSFYWLNQEPVSGQKELIDELQIIQEQDYISINIKNENTFSLKLISTSGQIIKQESNINDNIKINTNNLQQGFYIYEITDVNGSKVCGRFFKY